jgi:ABC-2 type transport system ATP-binding protein
VIFLDEPTTGLDPRSRRTMWNSIRELVASGVPDQTLLDRGELPDRRPETDRRVKIEMDSLIGSGRRQA